VTYYHLGGKNNAGEVETPHITGKITFLIYCSVCHYGFCKDIRIAKSPKHKQNLIFVPPCPRCLEAAKTGEPVEVLTVKDMTND